MLSWDKLFEMIVGIVLATITITLSIYIFTSINDASKREQVKLIAHDVAYSYKSGTDAHGNYLANHTNSITTGNPRDKNGNGIPDYLEQGVVEVPANDNSVPVVNTCLSIPELRLQYNTYVAKVPVEIVTFTNYMYYGSVVLTNAELLDLQNFLTTYSYNASSTYCVEVLQDAAGPYKYMIREIDPNAVTIAYVDNDLLDYDQVVQLLNIATTNFHAKLTSLTNYTYNQDRDSTTVRMADLHSTGFNVDSYAKIRIFKDLYRVERVELEEVVLSSVPDDVLDPGDTTEIIEEPPIEIPQVPTIKNIDWTKVCIGDLEDFYLYSNSELGSTFTNNGYPTLSYSTPTRIYNGREILDAYSYLAGVTTQVRLFNPLTGAPLIINSKANLTSNVDLNKNYIIREQIEEEVVGGVKTFPSSITIEEYHYSVPSNVNGALLTKAQVKSFGYNGVSDDFQYVTKSGVPYNKQSSAQWDTYLDTTPSNAMFLVSYSMDSMGAIKYKVAHVDGVKQTDWARNSLLTESEVVAFLSSSNSQSRVKLLNGVDIDFGNGKPVNGSPNYTLDYLKGNISSGLFKVEMRYETNSNHTPKTYIISETHPISSMDLLSTNLSWTKTNNLELKGFRSTLNSYYKDKGYFKCN